MSSTSFPWGRVGKDAGNKMGMPSANGESCFSFPDSDGFSEGNWSQWLVPFIVNEVVVAQSLTSSFAHTFCIPLSLVKDFCGEVVSGVELPLPMTSKPI